jgi:hypothetical protein
MKTMLLASAAAALLVGALINPTHAAEIKADGDTIFFIGPIKAGDAATFYAVADAAKPKRIIVESNGGELEPAIAIGRDIRRRGIATVVRTGATCASGCALIWLGGKPRTVETGAWIGLHHAGERVSETPGDSRSSDVANIRQVAYLRELGDVPEWAILLVSAVNFSRMAWIGRQLADVSGLTTLHEFPPAYNEQDEERRKKKAQDEEDRYRRWKEYQDEQDQKKESAHAEVCIVNDQSGTLLNVRSTPEGQIIGTLDNNTTISIGEQRGDWVRITSHEAPGKSGWVFRKYLKCGGEKAPAPKVSRLTCKEYVDMDTAARTSAAHSRFSPS